jgi:hypothetical protein
MKRGRLKQKEHPWVHALTCELSPSLSYHELKKLQEYVLDFLCGVPHDFMLEADDREREIQRGADRLKLISHRIVEASVPVNTTRARRKSQELR